MKLYLFSYLNCYHEKIYIAFYAKNKRKAIAEKPFAMSYERMITESQKRIYGL